MSGIDEVHARLMNTVELVTRATSRLQSAQLAVVEARTELQQARANVEGLQGEPGFSALVSVISGSLLGAGERCSAIIIACNAASFFAEAARVRSLRKAQTLHF
jgi:hypothetical protein